MHFKCYILTLAVVKRRMGTDYLSFFFVYVSALEFDLATLNSESSEHLHNQIIQGGPTILNLCRNVYKLNTKITLF